MKNICRISLAIFTLILVSSVARGQGVIRFVATYGADSNPCSRPQPCRTLQAGVNATPDGAELQILDSGDYGPNVSIINKSITISAPRGNHATLSLATGVGITINAPGKRIVLRGLLLDGATVATTGIDATAATAVYIERCEIQRFAAEGVLFRTGGRLSVKETVSRNNGTDGLSIVPPMGQTAQVVVDRSHFQNNGGSGVNFDSSLGMTEAIVTHSISSNNLHGFRSAAGSTSVNILNSIAANNTGDGFVIGSAMGRMNLERCVARGNGAAGMDAQTSATMRVTDSVSSNNVTGFLNASAIFESRSANNTAAAPGTNTVRGNTTNVTGTITYVNGN